MKVSLNLIREKNRRYEMADDVVAIGVDELIEKIGAQLGAVEEVIDLGKRYQNIAIVRVISCQKHPNADKLSLCKIDDGGVTQDVERDNKGYVQVVCGAPNAREDILVAWLPPGSTVPATVDNQPFVLEAREIRGQKSNGMLASPKELALGESHTGILEIDGDHKPGSDFAETFGLKDEALIDIENKMFTHRPDCFGWLGVARELAGIQGLTFKSPDWYTIKPDIPAAQGPQLPLSVKNELPELVPRFTAITMSNVRVGLSPVWLQVELAKVGQKSINNIVDYTNYFMLQTGQPLHAYDYDKLKDLCEGQATIVVRKPRPSEKVTLLGGQEIEPKPETIMIATDLQLLGMGGIKGGQSTAVDENTKNLILEAATFDMYATRRSVMANGVFSEAATRFTKGQSPLQNLAVQARIIDELRQQAGGQVAGTMIDDNHLDKIVLERGSLHPPVDVQTEFINARLGLKLTVHDMKKLLENVEFKVDISGDELSVTAPFWRTDIELSEDVVEEVGRLYGYDHLPLELPLRNITPTIKDPLLSAKAQLRYRLSKAGANELLTYSFVNGDLLDKVGQDKSRAFQVANALSPDLQYYRLSLIPSLLDKVHLNIKAGYDEFALFEIGKTHGLEHGDEHGVPKEFEFTALVLAANDKLKKAGAAYFHARKFLEALVSGMALEFKPVSDAMKAYSVIQPYDLNRSALVSLKGGDFLGIIGEFKPSVARQLKLPKYAAGFEVDTSVVLSLLANGQSYTPLPRFPKITQDITLKVKAELSFQELYDFIAQELDTAKPNDTHAQLTSSDIYQKDEGTKHVTFRLTIASYNRTLTDAEVNQLLDTVAAIAKTKISAQRV